MGLIPYNRVFDVLEHRFVPADLPFPVTTANGPAWLTAVAARRALYLRSADPRLREEIWREAVGAAQRDTAAAGPDRLLVLWLALPAMRRTLYRIAIRWAIDRRELESETLLALLAALADVTPQAQDSGHALLCPAANQVWTFAKARVRERPVADIAALAAVHLAVEAPAESPVSDWQDGWELRVSPPARPDGLSATVRFSVTPGRLESFRLGELAGHLGLGEIVHRARRPSEGSRIGTLSLRPVGGRR
ncbi:hypothetical protein GA0115240_15427 [Streptomyces sp. DvalAA-14]|uniref:hypothetical protein n=1 Tax=unclassified Streptomyces TaxID=2593676 RepID=UPI00081B60CA|nr:MULTISPECIES: hypothetical protein [unclassified Streptomyces]MYS23603.1 hypothetical protein [Streptomyces sp. SID4948]SCE36044.1 hypothetical protein GA0115240_15427 [Streptomyces sp. DvalAA-14]